MSKERSLSTGDLVENIRCTLRDSFRQACCCNHPISMGEYVPCPEGMQCAEGINDEETQTLLKKESSVSISSEREFSTDNSSTSTVFGSIFTLTNTILGSGTLAIPYAIAESGYVVGLFILVVIAFITLYSVRLLLEASDKAGSKCAKTYESLGHYTMGRFGTYLAEFTFIFGGFGTLVSYFIYIASLLCAVFQLDESQYKSSVMSICTIVIIMPLSLSRKIGTLQIVSLLSTLSVAYVVGFCGVFYHNYTQQSNSDEILKETYVVAFNIDAGSVYTVTLLIGAFACHNTTLPVYEELKDRSLSRMTKAVSGAILIASVLYIIIGICGYLTFGSNTMDNILLNYSATSENQTLWLMMGQLCMAFALLLTVPTALWPFRSCICSVYLRFKNGKQTPSSASTVTEYTIVTLLAELSILICALYVPSVKIPLSIVGSVSGSLIIFIMPSLFYLLQQDSLFFSWNNAGPLLLFFSGIVVGVVGFSLTMYKIFMEFS